MKKFFERLIKYRVVVIIATVVLTILAGIGAMNIKINSDISTYLNSDSMSRKTIDMMHEKFNIEGDTLLAISDVSLEDINEVKQTINSIGELETINHNILWLGQYSDFLVDRSGKNVLTIPESEWNLTDQEKQAFKDFIGKYYVYDEESNKGTYIFYISLTVPNSSQEAFDTIDDIYSIMEKTEYKDYYVGGSASQSKAMLESALGGLPYFMAVAVIIIMLILLLTSSSYLEPIIFLLTIGISIILNLGTNFFLGEVSSVTFSASSILQLALAMDYSIFLMHAYYDEKKKESDNKKAMINALSKTIVTVSASALTTVGGFVALFAMRFGLGYDLGIVLAKGVILSLVSVLFFQPCLILTLDKFVSKTQHKSLNFKFNKLTKSLPKWKIPALISALVILIPAAILQSKVEYYYLDSITYNENAVGAQKVVQDSGSQMMLIVDKADDKELQLEFYNELLALNKDKEVISDITGIYPLEYELKSLFTPGHPYYPFISNLDLTQFEIIKDKFIHENETYYIIQVTGIAESQECIDTVNNIGSIAQKYFGDHYYMTGNTQVVIDLEKTTGNDFLIIAVLSALIIFFILIFTCKSLVLSLILIFTIELGIFINLGITALIGQPINFVSYLIISAIQLGATVDYAILLTKNFQQSKESTNLLKMEDAMQHSIMSILVSALILVSACMSVYFISSDKIIREITFLIARGSAISLILVSFVLPGLILLYKKDKVKKDKEIIVEPSIKKEVPIGGDYLDNDDDK